MWVEVEAGGGGGECGEGWRVGVKREARTRGGMPRWRQCRLGEWGGGGVRTRSTGGGGDASEEAIELPQLNKTSLDLFRPVHVNAMANVGSRCRGWCGCGFEFRPPGHKHTTSSDLPRPRGHRVGTPPLGQGGYARGSDLCQPPGLHPLPPQQPDAQTKGWNALFEGGACVDVLCIYTVCMHQGDDPPAVADVSAATAESETSKVSPATSPSGTSTSISPHSVSIESVSPGTTPSGTVTCGPVTCCVSSKGIGES